MASSFSQSPFFSSIISINNKKSIFTPKPNNFITFKNSKISSLNSDESSQNPQQDEPESQDPIKLAFAKVQAYKKSNTPNPKTVQIPLQEPLSDAGPVEKEVPLAVKLALEKANEYKKSKGVVGSDDISSMIVENSAIESGEVDEKIENLKSVGVIKDNGTEKEVPLAVKLAMEKAKEYKKSKGLVGSDDISSKVVENSVMGFGEVDEKNGDLESVEAIKDDGEKKEAPLALKIAMEKAKEYKKSKGFVGSEDISSKIVENSVTEFGEVDGKNDDLESRGVVKDNDEKKEVPSALKIAMEKANEYKKNKGVGGITETLTSGVTEGTFKIPGDKKSSRNAGKKEGLTVSSMDFVGLGFSDKKSGRSLPAGLIPLSDPFPEGELPEVEIIVGDTSRFDNVAPASVPTSVDEDEAELYKPKVSTWGVFPRPNDISKTYGGGRTLRPGEALETSEEKAAKQARTRQLLAAYKKKIGMNIDPKLKSECEKALTDGDSLMDRGKLTEALPFYEKIMEQLPFQTELHGLAALQWSICQDSMTRPNEARMMYEKLQSHPVPKVSKKARQFVFGFQAMEMLKVKSSGPSPFIGYQNYFDAFVRDRSNYSLQDDEVDEAALSQALPYVIFLASPIILVLLIAASR